MSEFLDDDSFESESGLGSEDEDLVDAELFHETDDGESDSLFGTLQMDVVIVAGEAKSDNEKQDLANSHQNDGRFASDAGHAPDDAPLNADHQTKATG